MNGNITQFKQKMDHIKNLQSMNACMNNHIANLCPQILEQNYQVTWHEVTWPVKARLRQEFKSRSDRMNMKRWTGWHLNSNGRFVSQVINLIDSKKSKENYTTLINWKQSEHARILLFN